MTICGASAASVGAGMRQSPSRSRTRHPGAHVALLQLPGLGDAETARSRRPLGRGQHHGVLRSDSRRCERASRLPRLGIPRRAGGWLHKGQEVVRLPQPVWRALAAVPHADRTLNDSPYCYYVVVEDGPRPSAPRMPGGVVIFAGMYVWRRGATWVAPTFTDNKRRIYLRMYPYRLRASEPEVEAGILAMDRIASNLLRALADHRLSRLDLVARHDNRPRAVRAADPLRERVRRLALTADPIAVWSPQRVPAQPEPLPAPAERPPHASPGLHAIWQHLSRRWVCEANATDAERQAAREGGRTRGHLVAVHRTVHPFVRGAGSLRPRVTEVTLREAGTENFGTTQRGDRASLREVPASALELVGAAPIRNVAGGVEVAEPEGDHVVPHRKAPTAARTAGEACDRRWDPAECQQCLR